MHKIIENKSKIILTLLIISGFLLGTRLLFFLQDGTNKNVESILIKIIAYISVCVVLLMLIPEKFRFKKYIIKYRDIIVFACFLFYSEIIFIIDNSIRYGFVTFFSLVLIISIFVTVLLIIPKNGN